MLQKVRSRKECYMSSLLQHHGSTTDRVHRGKVELLFKGPDWDKYHGYDSYDRQTARSKGDMSESQSTSFCTQPELVELIRPNGTVAKEPKLYRCWRKPVGMWGNWVVFRYNGSEHVPDLSVPISTFKLPRGAEPLTDEEA